MLLNCDFSKSTLMEVPDVELDKLHPNMCRVCLRQHPGLVTFSLFNIANEHLLLDVVNSCLGISIRKGSSPFENICETCITTLVPVHEMLQRYRGNNKMFLDKFKELYPDYQEEPCETVPPVPVRVLSPTSLLITDELIVEDYDSDNEADLPSLPHDASIEEQVSNMHVVDEDIVPKAEEKREATPQDQLGEQSNEAPGEQMIDADGDQMNEADGELMNEADGERVNEADGEQMIEAAGEQMNEAAGEQMNEAAVEQLDEAAVERLDEADGEPIIEAAGEQMNEVEGEQLIEAYGERLNEAAGAHQHFFDESEHSMTDAPSHDSSFEAEQSVVDTRSEVRGIPNENLAQFARAVESLPPADPTVPSYRDPDNFCFICSTRCSNASTMMTHMAIHFNSVPHHCNMCNTQQNSVVNLNRHLAFHHTDRPYKCNKCKRMFADAATHKWHDTKFHTRQSLVNTLQTLLCDICGKCYRNAEQYELHVRQHERYDQAFKCDMCERSFPRYIYLMLHVETHAKQKHYQCSHCSIPFAALHMKLYHERQHSNAEGSSVSFRCPLCMAAYNTKHRLITHVEENHPGDTRVEVLQCSQNDCGQKFVDSTEFKQHLAEHREGKKLRCKFCTRVFKRRALLKSHLRTVHGKTGGKTQKRSAVDFACTDCEIAFRHERAYNLHLILVHSGRRR